MNWLYLWFCLSDLPGFTRSVYKRDHALISPESHVYSPLPDWYSRVSSFVWLRCLSLLFYSNLNCFGRVNTSGAYLISPEIGSHFVMYLAKLKGLITTYFSASIDYYIYLVAYETFSHSSEEELLGGGINHSRLTTYICSHSNIVTPLSAHMQWCMILMALSSFLEYMKHIGYVQASLTLNQIFIGKKWTWYGKYLTLEKDNQRKYTL